MAAGSGKRMGGVDKAFSPLSNIPLAGWSLKAFDECPLIGKIALVVREDLVERARELLSGLALQKPVSIVAGGARRQDSALAGIRALGEECEIVAIHDAARPFVTPELISRCIASAVRFGSGVAARRVVDTLKECESEAPKVIRTIDRANLWAIATPQVFRRGTLLASLEKASAEGMDVTDDASAVECAGGEVRLVEWNDANFKITYRDDLRLAEALMEAKRATAG